MQEKFLTLNESKSEILLVGMPTTLHKLNFSLSSLFQVCNLGIIFNVQLRFNANIKMVLKPAFLHLRNIARLRPSLPDEEKVVCAFIASRLDYCNPFYSGLPDKSIKQQYSAALVLTHTVRQH